MIRIKWNKPRKNSQSTPSAWNGFLDSLLGRKGSDRRDNYPRYDSKDSSSKRHHHYDDGKPKEKTILFGLIGREPDKPERSARKVIYVDSRGRVVDGPRGSSRPSHSRRHTYAPATDGRRRPAGRQPSRRHTS